MRSIDNVMRALAEVERDCGRGINRIEMMDPEEEEATAPGTKEVYFYLQDVSDAVEQSLRALEKVSRASPRDLDQWIS